MKTKIALLLVFLVAVSFNVFAVVEGGGNTVEIPLDGGLLTILGAAGVAYFVARKKKKNQES